MKFVRPITKAAPMPRRAESILSKGAQIGNLREAAAAIQEFFDIVMKPWLMSDLDQVIQRALIV